VVSALVPAPEAPGWVVTCGAAVGGLLGVVGTTQLGVQLRRALGD
jgi:CDP-diacylglycerol--glycerol-3-phosphate 3-phosphatidyltransferase